ncbi:hypothetical protein CfE428DRAFT_1323 [Chthoniobacter flavus Ellin428]|uniref:Uncharacterized protein n=1 Tax=Chthoniobacter flavus Ellin428 TaxID=497964 RepID=B4CXN2_9BACT|nr:hypothetical protein CfE428DRAFT_1323 [Chthoniobacter flavus Ellin428]TCO88755.1 hypothetical protein EV701_116127 [Chthoniobacter flavus]
MQILELPSLRIASIPTHFTSGRSPDSEMRDLHASFVNWEQRTGVRTSLLGCELAPGQLITHGARWRGEWRGDHSALTAFSLCLFLQNNASPFSALREILDKDGAGRESALALTYTQGGQYAELVVEGPYANIRPSVETLLHDQLPSTEFAYSGGDWLEIYGSLIAGGGAGSMVPALDESKFLTKVYCPVVRKDNSRQFTNGRTQHGIHLF